MRTKNSLKNISYNIISFIFNIILVFILRKIMVLKLGYEYIGLNTFLVSLVGFLSLTELGVSQAVTYSLYKPLAEKNFDKISEIIVLYKKIYHIIGLVIVFISFIIAPFIKVFIKNNEIKNIFVYFLLYTFLTASSYLICYRDILINADQKGYLLIKRNTMFSFINKILQIFILYITASYLFWIIGMVIITLFNYLSNNQFIKRKYPAVEIEKYSKYNLDILLKNNKELLKNSYTTFIYKISLFITYKTDDVLITYLAGITLLGKYSNYILVTSLVANFVASTLWSLNSVIGNLIVESSKEKIYNMWKFMTWISFYMATILVFCITINIQNLIKIWIGESGVLSFSIIIILMINFYIRIIREPLELFRNGFGIFDGTKGIVILEAILNLIISYVLGIKYGIIGVILGTLFSYLICSFWFMPYITFKYGFKKNIVEYFLEILKNILSSFFSVSIGYFILKKISINNFYISCILSFLIINIIYLLLNIKNINLKMLLKKIKLEILKVI